MKPRAPTVLARRIGPAYRDALGQDPAIPPIDLPLAQAQHAAYLDALAALGAELVVLPDDDLPDGCFVEDTAIVVPSPSGPRALVTRPGAISRRAETFAVHTALQSLGVTCDVMAAPATLDGGDVLRLGDRLLVGRSDRTNAEGVAALAIFAHAVGLDALEVPVPAGTLHLKCHATSPLPGLLVMARGVLPRALVPRDVTVVEIPDAEAYAANTIGLGDTVLVAAGFPETARRIAAAGARVVTVATTEIAKAAGSLTCLSLVIPAHEV